MEAGLFREAKIWRVEVLAPCIYSLGPWIQVLCIEGSWYLDHCLCRTEELACSMLLCSAIQLLKSLF